MEQIAKAESAIEAIEKRWAKRSGLLVALLVYLLVCSSLATFLPGKWVGAGFLLGTALIATAWSLSRRMRKCPRDKVGFVIAIHYETEELRRLFRSDFVDHLRRLLVEGDGAGRFWVHEQATEESITLDQARVLRERIGAAFVLFGRVRTRGSKDPKRIVDLRGLVAHAPLNEKNRKLLEKEFSELLPRRLIADAGSELPGFELGSALAHVVARYIIGIASECSGDFDYAASLFKDAERGARTLASSAVSPLVKKILERIPIRFAEMEMARARQHYNAWRQSGDDASVAEMHRHLMSAPKVAEGMLEWRTLMAIYEILSKGSYKKARGLIVASGSKDAITKLNIAFLDAISNNLKGCVRNYRAAASMGVTLESAEEVMDFIDVYRERNPDARAVLSFALGFIAYAILEDRILAGRHFDEFVRLDREQCFSEQARLVPKWLSEMALA